MSTTRSDTGLEATVPGALTIMGGTGILLLALAPLSLPFLVLTGVFLAPLALLALPVVPVILIALAVRGMMNRRRRRNERAAQPHGRPVRA